uniref:NB-ARC domain-containing protein n=2 Tax=Chenopodium quinoa TaxID=63459 RepID=A0A803M9Q9_CHEQI
MISMIYKMFGIGRHYRGVPCDGGTNNSGVENQSELRSSVMDEFQSESRSSVYLQQPEIKRRKVEVSLSLNTKYVNRIIDWLKDDKIVSIGVYGMAGVGKTTLAKQLEFRLRYETPFTDVYAVGMVSVGVDFNVYQLQQKIAGAFRLDLGGDRDETRRAAKIHSFLSRNDKCVLILDDLWDEFRYEDVGIPRKCKLIAISRSRDVCRMLHCRKFVLVEPLSEEESWELFHQSIGGEYLDSKQESHFRKLVCDKCSGLPLAITGLARCFRKMVDDNLSSWREVLEGAKFPFTRQDYLEDAFSRLKFSYEKLNNITLQRCFLYSALYPKGFDIRREELIRLWMGEKLIDNVSSLQARYDMGHSILNKLLNSCLLEASEDKRTIKIHDLVRHMALSVAGDSFLVEAGKTSKLEFRKNLLAVSLINSSISPILPDGSQNYSYLSTLLLQHSSFELIPESFFLQMRALRVLNLSATRLLKLPSSIGALEELQFLDLSLCQNLKQVPQVSNLLKLQFLDLSQTAIKQVPRFLEKLEGLTELNLSSILEPKEIPCGVLPALFRLKRLACQIAGAISELQNVKSLEILDARFLSLCDLSNYVRSQHSCQLDRYHLKVGGEVGSDQPYSRKVSLHGCSLTDQEEDYIVLPNNIQELYVDNCRDFPCLSDVLYPVAYPPRTHDDAIIGSCNEELSCLNQQAKHFSSLEVCIISRCQDIKTLFTLSWMESLQSLRLLQVEDCRQVKELIAVEVVDCGPTEGEHAVICLPQLRQLVLILLPQMESIYKGRLVCALLLSCTVMDCPKLKRLPFSRIDAGEESFVPCLERIEGQEKWWDLLVWDQPESKSLLKPLFRCRSLDDKIVYY